jgi:hypothetical protein
VTSFHDRLSRIRPYPTLRERHLTRLLAEEREVNHGLYIQRSFLLDALRRVGEHLQIANTDMIPGRGNGSD